MLPHDDRAERPEGVVGKVVQAAHPVMQGVPEESWPALLGFNRVTLAEGAELLATVEEFPLVATDFGRARAQCGVHLRLQSALVPDPVHGLARLCHAVAQPVHVDEQFSPPLGMQCHVATGNAAPIACQGITSP